MVRNQIWYWNLYSLLKNENKDKSDSDVVQTANAENNIGRIMSDIKPFLENENSKESLTGNQKYT